MEQLENRLATGTLLDWLFGEEPGASFAWDRDVEADSLRDSMRRNPGIRDGNDTPWAKAASRVAIGYGTEPVPPGGGRRLQATDTSRVTEINTYSFNPAWFGVLRGVGSIDVAAASVGNEADRSSGNEPRRNSSRIEAEPRATVGFGGLGFGKPVHLDNGQPNAELSPSGPSSNTALGTQTLADMLSSVRFERTVTTAGTQPMTAPFVSASHTPDPTSVTIAGSLQSEAGCAGDWDPACAITHLTYDAGDDVWQGSWIISPGGSYEFKAALNDGWAENYGQNATADGANIPVTSDGAAPIKFYYDHKSHWVTDNSSSVIAVAPGSFQSELGCSDDWDPSCLRSWLQDPDGDDVYTFETTALPAGNYEGKVALDESWDVNFGAGGIQDGDNISFLVPTDGERVTFKYNAANHILSIHAGFRPDNNVAWDGLRHDSRETLYRTPGGAVPAGTPVTIRFRTFHNDVTEVNLRLYDLNASAPRFIAMKPAATDVDCYEPGLEQQTCDFWSATLNEPSPNNLWYRYVVRDGADTAYYGDNTSALDGGLGKTTDEVVDLSYALMFYDPAFTAPSWASEAVTYQIFPDRFHNGNQKNDPETGDVRYDDPVLQLDWNTLPEGYCRNYDDSDTNCPWRFDDTPPEWSPSEEIPRNRDYFGGDLKGVTQKLGYIKSLGVTAIYLNPIFYAQSNHRYDTADYLQIDPALGTLDDLDKLIAAANQHGIKLILDGVFNHVSSDSPFFDRYQHFPVTGACESGASPYRDWFNFRAPSGTEPSPCAPSSAGGADTYYDGWSGFDSIPVLKKTNPAVQEYFLTGDNSVAHYWLNRGASGWRLDSMGDTSFPNGYWETFRQEVKADRDAQPIIIGELWQKDSTLLRHLRGDRADTTMNYRLRDAVIGLLASDNFDFHDFGDSGRPIEPSEFAARVSSIREDYPDAAYYSLMNLLDSHDTERLLWTLTPGAETRADRELNAANLASGKQRMRLASLIQFTMPGSPTVYYGDEVGVTGDNDPDNRRVYPWPDTGGSPDNALLRHYSELAKLRRMSSAFTAGDLRILLADDANDTLAYGRKAGDEAALIMINRSNVVRTVAIPVAGYLPDGTELASVFAVDNKTRFGHHKVGDGLLEVTLNPMSGAVLVTRNADLTPTAAPMNLHIVAEGNGQVDLAWETVAGAVNGYNLYRSPVSGGGWVKVNGSPITHTTYSDTGLRNARDYYYTVTTLDSAGNESQASNEVSALPHYDIGWANLQWPPVMTHTVSVTDRTDYVYGQAWIDGVTSAPGSTDTLIAQIGFGPDGSNPASNPDWVWAEAGFNADAGINDEFQASILPEAVGDYDYVYRYTTTNGRDWLYADLSGPIASGAMPPNPGTLTVNSSGDTAAPAAPTGLHVNSASASGIDLRWDAAVGDPSLYGYEVRRSNSAGGPYTTLALITTTTYVDSAVSEDATYYYVVRSVDTSFNRSTDSAEVAATAQLRTVTLVFNVEVPASTDGTGRPVYIAGFLDLLDGNLPQWNPGGVVLTRVDATHWTIILTGKETTHIEYKYALGSWNFVEKDDGCGEVANRELTLSYGTSGTQVVNDAVINWHNVAPCGN